MRVVLRHGRRRYVWSLRICRSNLSPRQENVYYTGLVKTIYYRVGGGGLVQSYNLHDDTTQHKQTY